MIPVVKKILFTTDLTESSRHAFYHAVSLATHYRSGLIILHVMEKLSTGVENALRNFMGEEKWLEIRSKQEQDARHILIGKRQDHEIVQAALTAFCASEDINPNRCSFDACEIIVKPGRVVEEITETARAKECDLLVMGVHKGLLGSTAVGSVVKGVLHQSRIPVLVVPPPEGVR